MRQPRKAHAIDFILDLPDGFETIVGEHGHKLEPSQAFRIALARAIIGEPSVLIIEEPFEHFDEASAAIVNEALHNVSAGRTLLIIPHRLSTFTARIRCWFSMKES